MAKVLIPTPLRQYAGKQDAVELAAPRWAKCWARSPRAHGPAPALYNDEGKLRSFVNVYLNDEDIRYMQKDATPVKDGDTISIVPSIAGGSATDAAAQEATLSKDEILRYSRHLIMPEVGMEGQLKLKQAKVLLIGAGGLGAPLGLYLAAAGIGTHRPGGFRRRGFHEPAAAGDPRHQRRGPQEARFRGGPHARDQSVRADRSSTKWRSPARTRSTS